MLECFFHSNIFFIFATQLSVMRKVVFIGLFLLLFAPLWAQEGGSAEFSPLFFLKPKAELPKEINETSGLFFHNGRLWTHNDSGGKPILFALDTTTFEIVQKVKLSHAQTRTGRMCVPMA